MKHIKQYLARRKAAREQKKAAARDREIKAMLLGMPDELWERLGEDPEEARDYLKNWHS